tara:strand:- start:3528 stop:4280 length:753 start_codon:yes stop_codon:yes gene_type:complete
MSGHSKWSSIKHKKGKIDAKRGQLFTKLARDITMAARGGVDPEMNASLRLAISKAKDSNMPHANIERAIQRGSRDGDADNLEEVTYEGYGPGGTAVLVDAVTDNRNRTVAELRLVFSRGGGNLAENGAVAWQFETMGVIHVSTVDSDPDEVQLVAIEVGAFDVEESTDGSAIEVYTQPGSTESVREALTSAGFKVESADLAKIPQNNVELEEATAVATLRMLERLDDLDDVSKVHSNAVFTDAVLEAAAG